MVNLHRIGASAGCVLALMGCLLLSGCSAVQAQVDSLFGDSTTSTSSSGGSSNGSDLLSAAFTAIGTEDPYAEQVNQRVAANNGNELMQNATTQATADQAGEAQTTEEQATDTTETTDAAAQQSEQTQTTTVQANHTEGEAVTINGSGVAYDIYATWQRDGDGDWCATFMTNNGTWLYAYQDSAGAWTFYTGGGRQVICSTTPSDAYGYYGPYGTQSYWQDAADPTIWY